MQSQETTRRSNTAATLAQENLRDAITTHDAALAATVEEQEKAMMAVQADHAAKVQRAGEDDAAAAADASAKIQKLVARVRELTDEARDARPPTGRDDDD